MFKTDLKQEFINLCLKIESYENQIRFLKFNLKEKDKFKAKIKDANKQIDTILDEYNRERA